MRLLGIVFFLLVRAKGFLLAPVTVRHKMSMFATPMIPIDTVAESKVPAKLDTAIFKFNELLVDSVYNVRCFVEP